MERNEQENVDEGDSQREFETPSEPPNRRQDSFSTRFRRRSQNIAAAITAIFFASFARGDESRHHRRTNFKRSHTAG